MTIEEEGSVRNTDRRRVGNRLQRIIYDGWKYEFEPIQTVKEAAIMGYTIDIQTVKKCWAWLSVGIKS